jgi:hypothetical protein
MESVPAAVPKRIGKGAKQTPQGLRNLSGTPVVLVRPDKEKVVEVKGGVHQQHRHEVRASESRQVPDGIDRTGARGRP